jgi:hypothetical protein
MRTKLFSMIIVIFFLLACIPAFAETEGFNGIIYLRDGTQIEMVHLGRKENLISGYVGGKLGMQQVSYKFSELKTISFSNITKKYDGDGELIVIHKNGKRFTLTEAKVGNDRLNDGLIDYVYPDPVSGDFKNGRTWIKGTILNIEIGAITGKLKYNERTGEYFSAFFIYDPFTGEKLIWGTPGE